MLQSTGRRAASQLARYLTGPAGQQRLVQTGSQPTTGMSSNLRLSALSFRIDNSKILQSPTLLGVAAETSLTQREPPKNLAGGESRVPA